jgi:DNA-binding NarL/FixJ family response regulator
MNAATPVVVVSVVSDPRIMQDCIDAGANAYHVKPVRRLELIEQVKRQLAAQSATVK